MPVGDARDPAGAVAEFEAALRIDPSNQFAADNLRRVKPAGTPGR